MKHHVIGVAALALVACGNQDDRSAEVQGSPAGDAAIGTTTSGDRDALVALGMSERQLRDADLIGTNGEELGDVEGVVASADGTITHLLVEIEDSSPDRYVHVPVEGLEPFDNGDDRDLRTTMTRDQLMALPEVRR